MRRNRSPKTPTKVQFFVRIEIKRKKVKLESDLKVFFLYVLNSTSYTIICCHHICKSSTCDMFMLLRNWLPSFRCDPSQTFATLVEIRKIAAGMNRRRQYTDTPCTTKTYSNPVCRTCIGGPDQSYQPPAILVCTHVRRGDKRLHRTLAPE